ncbi:MAG: hypothetical protein HYR96_00870 [Deltaproteobacteria bacterium]|nr:hypothetical protein [Deltaproteobacteria bacterium]
MTPIIIAMGIVSVLSLMALTSSLSAGLLQKNVRQRIDRVEAFYQNEVVAWHSYLRKQDSLEVAANSTISDDYVTGVTIEADPYTPASGAPLNITTTRQSAPIGKIFRRYTAANAYAKSSSTNFCGSTQLGAKGRYQACLYKAALGTPGEAWIFDSQRGVATGTDVRFKAMWKDSMGVWQEEAKIFANSNQGYWYAPVVIDSKGRGYGVMAGATHAEVNCTNGVRLITWLGFQNWADECFLVDPDLILSEGIDIGIDDQDRVSVIYAVSNATGDQKTFLYRRRNGNSWEPPEVIDRVAEAPLSDSWDNLSIFVSLYGPPGNTWTYALAGKRNSAARYFFDRNPMTGTWGPGPDVDGQRGQPATPGVVCNFMETGRLVHASNGTMFPSTCTQPSSSRTLHGSSSGNPPQWSNLIQLSGPPTQVDMVDETMQINGWPNVSAAYANSDDSATFGYRGEGGWVEERIAPTTPGGPGWVCKHTYVSGKGILLACNRDTNFDGINDRIFEYS